MFKIKEKEKCMKEMRQRQFVIKMIVISHEKLKYCLVVRDDNDMFLITILDMIK